jgi:hypothetical protein
VGQPDAVKYIAPGNVPPLPANRKYKIPTAKKLCTCFVVYWPGRRIELTWFDF